jgi:hypothetical protein
MARKQPIDPDNPLKALHKLMRKLNPEQGIVARRNARAGVCTELRRLRAFIDSEYPTLTTKKAPRKRKTAMSRVNALLKRLHVHTIDRVDLHVRVRIGRTRMRVEDRVEDRVEGRVYDRIAEEGDR